MSQRCYRCCRSSGVVVGPHDEVLEATATARTLGLVRGSRIAVPELLQLVRSVRREGDGHIVDLQINRGARVASTYLTARVAPLDESLILILADDQTAARRIEETRRDFVANISHELKTPIGAISLLAEAVEDAADDPAAVRKFASRMGIESARLADLVGQIIELSRLQADNPLLHPEVVDIDEVLSDAVDRRRMDAERHRITLTVAGAAGTRVLGSARQLGVAVGNLVENAIVYSDPGARVVVAAHVQARSDDDYVEITVSDNGIGIPAAELDRIFERFYRVDYARSRANGGTGLGLAIVKHIAAIHGGDVTVWSQVGHGSTFTLKIPAHLHEAAPAVSEHATSTDRQRPISRSPERQEINQMTRVLVIEDEESYLEALSYMLSKEGFEVIEARDGAAGIAEFDRHGADIVLLDLMMPGLPGTEVCRQLRLRGAVPVIMLTARDTEVDKVVGLELGADDYVTKPFSHRELVARIRAVLRRGQDTELVPDVIEAAGVRMDVERHEVSVNGERITLALKEFELLEMLLRNAGRVMTRGQLIDRIWGADYVGDTKTLDVHVKRLRTKLEPDPANPRYLSPSEALATSSRAEVSSRTVSSQLGIWLRSADLRRWMRRRRLSVAY